MTDYLTPVQVRALGRLCRSVQRGFNLIELMVGIAIVSLVLSFMIPSMAVWLQSSQIRSAAEALHGGLQLARTEAVRRNTSVQLDLPSVDGAGIGGSDWVVRCATPTPSCPGAGQTETEIQMRAAQEGSPNAQLTVVPTLNSIVYTGTGRISPVPAADIVIDVRHVRNNACLADGGEYRCLRVIVTTSGQVRMCDPGLPNTNPRGC